MTTFLLLTVLIAVLIGFLKMVGKSLRLWIEVKCSNRAFRNIDLRNQDALQSIFTAEKLRRERKNGRG